MAIAGQLGSLIKGDFIKIVKETEGDRQSILVRDMLWIRTQTYDLRSPSQRTVSIENQDSTSNAAILHLQVDGNWVRNLPNKSYRVESAYTRYSAGDREGASRNHD